MQKKYLLAIDQGTTSCRSILFDKTGKALHISQKKLGQNYPVPGWVQQDLELLWQTQLWTVQECLKKVDPSEIASIGITNQRETIGLWDRAGNALTPAISWQCQRTLPNLQKYASSEATIRQLTGLPLNPYFSASKLSWLLENNPELNLGEVLTGTIDTWLIYKLTEGLVHATDPSNACRTLLFDLAKNSWSEELLKLFEVPANILPRVQASQGLYGHTSKALLGHEIPIYASVGDQQAALFGHACLEPGMAELTCGTGGFLLCNTGSTANLKEGLLTSVAWQLQNEAPVYTQEAAILSVGSMIEWLARVGLIDKTHDLDSIVAQADPESHLLVMPAVTGFGSPDWNRRQKACLGELTAQSGGPEILKATLEGIAFRVKQVSETTQKLSELRLGGGLSRSNYFCQFLADVLALKISRSANIEATAWGAASMADTETNHKNLQEVWQAERSFEPQERTKCSVQEKWEAWSETYA